MEDYDSFYPDEPCDVKRDLMDGYSEDDDQESYLDF